MLRDLDRPIAWHEAEEEAGSWDDDASSRVAWIRRHLPALAAVPLPGCGATVERFRTLAQLTGLDGSLGRLAEGHLDALAIVHELAPKTKTDRASVLGVWAAHPAALRARRTRGGWHLEGTKPWCSGAGLVDQALVTAVDESGAARLLLVDVGACRFADDWQPLGMRATESSTATLDIEVGDDREVGPPGGYVDRPGFWHGGIGVAACWHGLASRIAGDLVAGARTGEDPYLRAATGRAVGQLAAGRALLAAAARRIDADPGDEPGSRHLAGIARVELERSSRAVLDASVTARGAGALCFDVVHARAVADLLVYLRQLHPERDAAAIGLGDRADGSDPEVDWWQA